jgi:hypothetical protein
MRDEVEQDRIDQGGLLVWLPGINHIMDEAVFG